MNIKAGYSFNGRSLTAGEGLGLIRSLVNISGASGDLLGMELGDIALAAIIRFSVLKTFLYSNDAGLSCFAAGIIGAARSLTDRYRQVAGGWQADDSVFESWPSAVVKYAGAHLRALTQRGTSDPVNWGEMTRDLFICHNNCVPRALASTVSDDSGLSRKDLTLLYDEGVLIKPSLKVWKDFICVADLLSGNQFDLRNGGDTGPRLSFRFVNGNDGEKPWAPARTMALLSYAASVAPAAARYAICGSPTLRDMVRNQYMRFANERQRFSMWVCGNSAEPESQLKCFDLLVAALFDRLPFVKKEFAPEDSRLRYYKKAQLYSPVDQNCQKVRYETESSTVEMQLPPWAGVPGSEIFVPNIVPTSIGTFEAF